MSPLFPVHPIKQIIHLWEKSNIKRKYSWRTANLHNQMCGSDAPTEGAQSSSRGATFLPRRGAATESRRCGRVTPLPVDATRVSHSISRNPIEGYGFLLREAQRVKTNSLGDY